MIIVGPCSASRSPIANRTTRVEYLLSICTLYAQYLMHIFSILHAMLLSFVLLSHCTAYKIADILSSLVLSSLEDMCLRFREVTWFLYAHVERSPINCYLVYQDSYLESESNSFIALPVAIQIWKVDFLKCLFWKQTRELREWCRW